MPPYQYEKYDNRAIVGSIADMMQRAAEIRAQAALQSGQIQAHATQARGDAWGQAINQIGQAVGSIPAQMQQAKAQQQIGEMRAMELAAAKQQQAQRGQQQQDVAALDRAFSPAAALGPGVQGPMPADAPLPDRDTILKALPGHLQPVALKHFADIDETKAKNRATRDEFFASVAAGVHAFGNDPKAALIALQEAADDYPQQATQIKQLIEQNPSPEFVGKLTSSLMVKSPKYAAMLQKQETPKTREVKVTNPDGTETIQIVKDEPGQTFTSTPKSTKATTPGSFEDYVGRYAAEKNLVLQNETGRGNIPLYGRPRVKNADGSISTVRSMSFNDNGKEVLVPTVSTDGRIMTDEEAIATYHRTGQHLGMFQTPEEATRYAKQLHSEYETGKYDKRVASAADIEDARKRYQQADDRPRVTVTTSNGQPSDVKEAVAAMKEGTVPPLLPGRASKEYIATLAEAHRQGYDLQGAVTDWNATQKHLATMNGAQQLRLNQAINALPDMLDSVDALATKWKGGKFPILNRANLALAKGGTYGSDVASVANQLDAQIADVTADLGNVYMGGNSPTDHALGLAGKSLKGEWDEKVLHDMVALAKKNVTIRRNSIAHTGVAGASANNPYLPGATESGAPPPPAATPKATMRFNPATGKLEPIK